MISEGLYSAVLGPINIEKLNHSSYITVTFQGIRQGTFHCSQDKVQLAWHFFPEFPSAVNNGNSKLETEQYMWG